MSDFEYSDLELRMKAMPLAVDMLNTETQKVLGNCNTKGIALLTDELINILKYGAPAIPQIETGSPEDASHVVNEDTDVQPASVEAGPEQPQAMKYA